MTIVLAAGLLAAASRVSFDDAIHDRQALATALVTPQAPSDTEGFLLSSSDSDIICAAVRGAALSAVRSVLRVDGSCAALLPGMEQAKFWHEQADGSVIFTENGVDAIVTFVVADGAAYESVQPAMPVITLDYRD